MVENPTKLWEHLTSWAEQSSGILGMGAVCLVLLTAAEDCGQGTLWRLRSFGGGVLRRLSYESPHLTLHQCWGWTQGFTCVKWVFLQLSHTSNLNNEDLGAKSDSLGEALAPRQMTSVIVERQPSVLPCLLTPNMLTVHLPSNIFNKQKKKIKMYSAHGFAEWDS